VITGHNLSIADVVFAARVRSSQVLLDSSPSTRERVDKSQAVIDKKLEDGISVYGVSTGYGGSADTRTNDHLSLGMSTLSNSACYN
jgi:phenylalanine ammonia-lyase